MNYRETLDYLVARLPMFHRIGAAAYKSDLNNTIDILNLLENPHLAFKSIHLAGTNGKGSCSHMLAAILQNAGYRTGLYTSPHLKDFRERIRINGEMIPKEKVIDFVEKHKIDFEKIEPSFFEWTVGLAFHYFAHEKVDIAVIETGLGGRLDSTNIISPELSIITNISFDHIALLGDTIEKIAYEKAGIIKKNIPVVIGERQVDADAVFIEKAKKENAPIFFASDSIDANLINRNEEFTAYNIFLNGDLLYENIQLSLVGHYQQKNIATVLLAVEQLKVLGFSISENHVRYALKNIQQLTGLQGRWQTLQNSPRIICDVGHNKAGIEFIVNQLKEYKYNRLRMVIGLVNDKDASSILSLLPKDAMYYFCKANIPRALDENELKLTAENVGLHGSSYTSVKEAIDMAKAESSPNDLIFIGGSTFVVAES